MSWDRVRGHEFARQTIRDAVANGRLAHAYVFAGPSGIGKRLFAVEMAKALNCESPVQTLDACDRCSSCRLFDAGNHPDYVYATRPEDKNEFPIDRIREVIAALTLKSMRGGYKFAVIDEAESLNEESANAFLKTLEEPPPKTLLILIVPDSLHLLPTIRSRCQIVRFSPLPRALIVSILKEHGVESSRIDLLAQCAGGSAGMALDLSTDEFWAFRGELLQTLAMPKPDTVALGQRWATFVDEAGKESSFRRRRATLTVRLLLDMLRAALALSTGADSAHIAVADRDALQRLAERLGTDRIVQCMNRSLDAEIHIGRYLPLGLAMEALADTFR